MQFTNLMKKYKPSFIIVIYKPKFKCRNPIW